MDGPMNIFQWYNIIFIGPAFLSAFWIAYTIFTGIGQDMDGGHDHSVDVDHDHDIDHDDFDQGPSGAGVLDFLNLKNRCPKTLGFSILFLTWGALGYVINMTIVKLPGILFLPAFAGNVFGVGIIAILTVRTVAPIIAKSLPSDDYNYPTTIDMIGKRGKVSNLMSIENGGSIVIDIGGGAPLVKRARLLDSYKGETLGRNSEVVVVDLEGDILVCAPISEI